MATAGTAISVFLVSADRSQLNGHFVVATDGAKRNKQFTPHTRALQHSGQVTNQEISSQFQLLTKTTKTLAATTPTHLFRLPLAPKHSTWGHGTSENASARRFSSDPNAGPPQPFPFSPPLPSPPLLSAACPTRRAQTRYTQRHPKRRRRPCAAHAAIPVRRSLSTDS